MAHKSSCSCVICNRSCNAFLAALDRSPTFAMSLGAKELFHTNMLAFILEDNTPTLDKVRDQIRGVLGIPWHPGESHSCLVWREAGSQHCRLDLVVMPLSASTPPSVLSNRALVVEAKLKSIPTVAQLGAISAALPSVSVTLRGGFTAVGPSRSFVLPSTTLCCLLSDVLPPSLSSPWSSANWTQVHTAISSGLSAPLYPPVLPALLSDYANSLNSLTTILGCISAWVKPNVIWGEVVDCVTDAEFKDRRLHDLVGKYAFSLVLNGAIAPTVVTLIVPAPVAGFPWSVDSFVGYSSRGRTPLLHYGFKICNPTTKKAVSLGVQIEGDSFRHYVSCHPGNVIGLSSLVGPLWPWLITGLSGLVRAGTMSPTVPVPASLNSYKSAGETFMYAKRSVSADTVSKVSNDVLSSLSNLSTAITSSHLVQHAISSLL